MTSAVTRTPAALAALSTATVCALETWQTCSRAPASLASAQSRATIVSSAVAGQPARPSRDATTPSCACAPPVSRWSSACWAMTTSSARGVLQRPAHDQRIVHAAAVVGEHPHLGGRAGHRAQLRHPLAAQPDGDRADRVHVDEPHLGAAAAHVQRDHVGVDHGIGVGHREHRGEAAERGGSRARRDRLGLLAAGLPQVGVQVDEAGQQDEPVGVERVLGGEPGSDLGDHAVLHEDVDRLTLPVGPGAGDHEACHSGAPASRW